MKVELGGSVGKPIKGQGRPGLHVRGITVHLTSLISWGFKHNYQAMS